MVLSSGAGRSGPLNWPSSGLAGCGPFWTSRKSWLASVEKLRKRMCAPVGARGTSDRHRQRRFQAKFVVGATATLLAPRTPPLGAEGTAGEATCLFPIKIDGSPIPTAPRSGALYLRNQAPSHSETGQGQPAPRGHMGLVLTVPTGPGREGPCPAASPRLTPGTQWGSLPAHPAPPMMESIQPQPRAPNPGFQGALPRPSQRFAGSGTAFPLGFCRQSKSQCPGETIHWSLSLTTQSASLAGGRREADGSQSG